MNSSDARPQKEKSCTPSWKALRILSAFSVVKKKYKVLIRNIQKTQPRKRVAFLQISVALHRTASMGYKI